MKNRNKWSVTLISMLAAMLMCTGAQAEKQSAYQRAQESADSAYQAGEYEKAYKKYESLARKGDSFSQYRLSYMNFQGQGVDQDWNEAFAWALLAAQGNNPELVRYLGGLTRQMPEDYATSATVKAKSYMDRWGNAALAESALRKAERELRSCTGSRLGTRCEEVYSMRMPRFWNVQPVGTVDNPASTGGYISTGGGDSVGGAVLNTRYYQSVRWGLRDIEQYIMNNATNVQIGDLETVDN